MSTDASPLAPAPVLPAPVLPAPVLPVGTDLSPGRGAAARFAVAGAVVAVGWLAGRAVWHRVSAASERRRAHDDAHESATGERASRPSVEPVVQPDGSIMLTNAAGLADVRLRPAKGLITVTPRPETQRAVMIGGYRPLATDVIAAWPDPAELAPYRRQVENEIRNHATSTVLFGWFPLVRRRAEQADLDVGLYRTGGREAEWAVDHLAVADALSGVSED